MSAVLKHRDFSFDDYGEKKTWRLKKWSAAKLLSVVKDLGSIFEKVTSGVSGDTDNIKLFTNLAVTICESDQKAVELIQKSVDHPKVTPDEIYNMEAENFVGLLAEILEFNLRGGLAERFKNFLRALFQMEESPTGDSAQPEAQTNLN